MRRFSNRVASDPEFARAYRASHDEYVRQRAALLAPDSVRQRKIPKPKRRRHIFATAGILYAVIKFIAVPCQIIDRIQSQADMAVDLPVQAKSQRQRITC